MTKESEDLFYGAAVLLAASKEKKAEAEEGIKKAEAVLKDLMSKENLITATVQNYTVEIVKVAPTKVVDTAKLKAAGLFEKYSKDKAGYQSVKITNPENEFLCGLNNRRQKHIEDGKKQ